MENIALVGLSRQVALRRELDVIANNMANLNTTGFKADDVVFQEYLMPGARDETFPRGSDRNLSFVWDRATTTNMSQGSVEQTGNTLDTAIGGRGFFVVQTPEGERYTRNGSFEINAQGQMVTKQGHPVLSESGVINFEPTDTPPVIARDGQISVAAGQRGKLRIVDNPANRAFEKVGDNLYRLTEGNQATPVPITDVRQGYIEKSNVSPVNTLSRMIEVTRAYAELASSLDRHDQMRREAIRSLGNPAT
ncbi:flagellar basal-body rod protein FlgF [Phreatobacter aquaticus]|uniref:Flagellar basal-body rod protein FlgF n=1 Tax=Phreatobacter aquaticus TaxID=2570229 RepID=A0A4D7QVS5_9HYPH|nr:flagellar basal-body rod protein FlgF [Phreatobacter aquaticus]QCK88072.1 flagellar basal-body rod protein FlgF [Phreatobacter aquaticus]